MSHSTRKQYDLRAQRRLISAWTSSRSDQTLRCALNANLQADREDSGQARQMPRMI